MWQCSGCKQPIVDYKEGYLVADHDLCNWRVVHRHSCDPHDGPWHPLELFIGKRGDRVFRSMQRIGAFNKLSRADLTELRETIVRESYDASRVRRTKFRQWLRQQENRQDPIGDFARDMSQDSGQVLPNPSLNDLYHHIRICGACPGALRALVDAYREWQSYGNTYRETRDARPRNPRHKPAHAPAHRRDGWLKLRFIILKRDGYRCQICGRTAQDNIKLEVDHKLARSKGGSDDPTNLWTLCFDCNRGKRDENL